MEDKIAIVAGGTAGVGRAVVETLLARGYKVGVFARGEDRIAALQSAHPDTVMAVCCDVSDPQVVMQETQAIVAKWGAPTVWVNAAMLTSFSPFIEMEPEEFEAIVRTTFLGQVNGTRAALTVMRDENKPIIVNVGSGLSYRAVPFQSAYCAGKHAINGFTSALRSELIRDKRSIALSLVQLPALNTPQFDWARNRLAQKPQPAPPIYQPQVAADAVMKAIDTRAREIFVGKSVMQLIFGTMVLPNWLDHKLADSGAEMQKSGDPEPGDRPDNVHGPVERDVTAQGRFGDRAEDKALIVDGDLARKVVFFGAPAIAFVLGLIIG